MYDRESRCMCGKNTIIRSHFLLLHLHIFSFMCYFFSFCCLHSEYLHQTHWKPIHFTECDENAIDACTVATTQHSINFTHTIFENLLIVREVHTYWLVFALIILSHQKATSNMIRCAQKMRKSCKKKKIKQNWKLRDENNRFTEHISIKLIKKKLKIVRKTQRMQRCVQNNSNNNKCTETNARLVWRPKKNSESIKCLYTYLRMSRRRTFFPISSWIGAQL